MKLIIHINYINNLNNNDNNNNKKKKITNNKLIDQNYKFSRKK